MAQPCPYPLSYLTAPPSSQRCSVASQLVGPGGSGCAPLVSAILDQTQSAPCAHSGYGFIPTRDVCLLPQELPYQNRAFEPDNTRPQMFGGGGAGIGRQTDIETQLRVRSTRERDGCSVIEYRDYGNMRPLPVEWQQADYRPIHFANSTRNDLKDYMRASRGDRKVRRVMDPDDSYVRGHNYGRPNVYAQAGLGYVNKTVFT